MSKIVISECTSSTDAAGSKKSSPNVKFSSHHWWSPAGKKKIKEKKYTCELYLQMKQRLNKVNRRSRSLLPRSTIVEEDDDPGGVITESYVTRFSLIRSVFDVNCERHSFVKDRKASFSEVNAWIDHLDVQGGQEILKFTEF